MSCDCSNKWMRVINKGIITIRIGLYINDFCTIDIYKNVKVICFIKKNCTAQFKEQVCIKGNILTI